jgi:hypothetical protein
MFLISPAVITEEKADEMNAIVKTKIKLICCFTANQ